MTASIEATICDGGGYSVEPRGVLAALGGRRIGRFELWADEGRVIFNRCWRLVAPEPLRGRWRGPVVLALDWVPRPIRLRP